MANTSEIEGYKEAKKLLKELDKVTQKKVVLSVLRKASRPIITSAKSKIASKSKTIAKSIRFRQIRSTKKISGSIKPGGKDAWYPHFIEFGTSGIVKKSGGYKRESDNPAFSWVGRLGKGVRFRQDQQAVPFMRPAIAENKGQTKALLQKGFTEDIDKTIKKFKK
jgi:HK97 gp10 family phage protein